MVRFVFRWIFMVWALPLATGNVVAAGAGHEAVAAPYATSSQVAHFPIPLAEYEAGTDLGTWEKIRLRAARDPFNVAATVIFVLAVLHTFAAGWFRKKAHEAEEAHHAWMMREERAAKHKPHENAEDDVSFKATIYHFLGEVEAIFGIWVLALMAAGWYFYSWDDVKAYVGHDVNFTEPLFVVVIMAIAASRPVLLFAEKGMAKVAGVMGGTVGAWWLSVMTLAPVLGSFITEPAAMTIAAMILRRKLYRLEPSEKLAYGTLGLLFVNISIGGTLTNFAAPPILMVANTWDWSSSTVLMNIGIKCAMAILLSNVLYFVVFRGELAALERKAHPELEGKAPLWVERDDPVPWFVTAVHLIMLGWTVFTNHYPPLFIGGFLFFIAFVQATGHHQNAINMRSPILVGFFLAALVIHGGCQGWWIEPLLTSGLHPVALLIGSAGLTAFNDNAAITYLASQAPGLSDYAKYMVVAGAVAGGGLTVIANAPNPAGQSILQRHFKGGISPAKLVMGALVPTVVAILLLMLVKSALMHD
ncbi:MAG: putative Na+/H+ antiporter [Verrucomicrobiales bacterium]|nr:putative Na+/H+ antiporter [Verrucomicrobiales bacterium]